MGKESGKGEVKDILVGGGEALKGKELGKELGKGEVKDNPVGEGDRQQPMVLLDLLKEGVAEPDHEGEDQEGDKEGAPITLTECTLYPSKNKNEADRGESSSNSEDESICFSV